MCKHRSLIWMHPVLPGERRLGRGDVSSPGCCMCCSNVGCLRLSREQPAQPALLVLISHSPFSFLMQDFHPSNTFKKFIMFTARSHCRLFGIFIIHFHSLAGKKMMLSLNSPTASVLVHTAWSFVVCVMGGHRSFVAFFFSTPFRTYFMPQRVCCCFWFFVLFFLKGYQLYFSAKSPGYSIQRTPHSPCVTPSLFL